MRKSSSPEQKAYKLWNFDFESVVLPLKVKYDKIDNYVTDFVQSSVQKTSTSDQGIFSQ